MCSWDRICELYCIHEIPLYQGLVDYASHGREKSLLLLLNFSVDRKDTISRMLCVRWERESILNFTKGEIFQIDYHIFLG